MTEILQHNRSVAVQRRLFRNFAKPGLLSNRPQGTAYVVSNFGETLLFSMKCQLHQGCFQTELILLDPFQHIRQRILVSLDIDSFRKRKSIVPVVPVVGSDCWMLRNCYKALCL